MVRLFYSDYTTNNGTAWTVEIWDTFLTTWTAFEVDCMGFSMDYNGNIKDSLTSPIVSSEVSITVDNFGNPLKTFISGLLYNDEGRYLMKVIKDSNFEWAGVVLQDFGGLDDIDTQNFKISATDGVARLKNMYPADSTLTGPTMLDMMIGGLASLETAVFWTTDQVFLKTWSNWKDSRIPVSVDPLDNTNNIQAAGVVPYIFKTIEEVTGYNGIKVTEINEMSWYDIIQTLYSSYNMRLVLVRGAWTLISYENLADASITTYNYKKGGATVTATSNTILKDITTSNNYRGGGSYAFLPGLKSVTVKYLSKDGGNLLPQEPVLGTTYDVRSLTFGTGNYLHFKIDVDELFKASPGSTNLFTFYQLHVKIGTYYLTNSGWTTTPSTYEIASSAYIGGFGTVNTRATVDIYTPDLPVTGEPEIKLSLDTTQGIGSVATSTIRSTLKEFACLYILSNDGPNDYINLVATNDNGFNFEIKLKDSLIGSSGTLISKGSLQTSNGTTLTDSGDWGTIAGTKDKEFCELLVSTVLSMQTKPTIQWSGKIGWVEGYDIDYLNAVSFLFNDSTSKFIPNKITYNDDVWTGDWIELDVVDTDITLVADPITATVPITATLGATQVQTFINPYSGELDTGGAKGTLGALEASGIVTLTGLPTEDPAVVDELWNDSGTVKISI